jgi:hypothetical protein
VVLDTFLANYLRSVRTFSVSVLLVETRPATPGEVSYGLALADRVPFLGKPPTDIPIGF